MYWSTEREGEMEEGRRKKEWTKVEWRNVSSSEEGIRRPDGREFWRQKEILTKLRVVIPKITTLVGKL